MPCGLRRCIRADDTVARIGGDEFVILAPEVDSHLHAVDIGARLIAGLAAEGVAASIGVSVSVHGRGNAETLLNEADRAMYHAKSLGGARAEVFDLALRHQVHERTAALAILQSALDEHRVVVHYQPIVRVATQRFLLSS